KVTNQAQIPRELQLKIALTLWNKLDVLGVAGTGQGKTLASVLNQLLEESDKVTVMLCPLKWLQLSHISLRFSTKYAIEAISINEDTDHDEIIWNVCVCSVPLFIVTPEQFFRNSAGHYSRWGEYIRDPQFGTRINIMIVDEAHCVATQGIAQY
ncbi:hypothetical protein EV359DRAFT_14644, partial [Lentinula novae-zelandiae]